MDSRVLVRGWGSEDGKGTKRRWNRKRNRIKARVLVGKGVGRMADEGQEQEDESMGASKE